MSRLHPATKIFLGSSVALLSYYQYKVYRRDLPEGVTALRYGALAFFPSNAMTKAAGVVSEWHVPAWMRPYTIGAYARVFGCSLDDAEKGLKEYSSLGEFFSRRLKAGIRPVDRRALLVSPADGRVLHYGQLDSLEGSYPEQVKGVRYALKDLVPASLQPASLAPDESLYYCTIYLSPGSYHRFHSPTEWRIQHSVPIRGEVLPVASWMMRWLPGLVCLNQRHALVGGRGRTSSFFAMVPVGATNVGSIVIDKGIGERCRRGDELGHFRMGSTVVLVFAAPRQCRWALNRGELIRMGEPLLQGPAPSRWWPLF